MSTGQSLWQVLPLGPTGHGNSPYDCLSVFAGNPLLISLEWLVTDGLLEVGDLSSGPLLPEQIVDYDAVTRFKLPLLRKSFDIFEIDLLSAISHINQCGYANPLPARCQGIW